MILRILGFAASLAVYLRIAGYFFLQIMIGDCAVDPVEHAQCEAARSNWLLGLGGVSLVVFALLIWAFFLRHGARPDRTEAIQ